MKVALVHDYIKEYGGAERVLEALHEVFPNAPVYTSLYLPSFLGPHRERFKEWDIRTSWLQYIPFKQKLISPLRLISSFAFRSFNFSEYDVVIVSATGAYFPNTIKTKIIKNHYHSLSAIRHKPVHICYCHTPPRYLYGYATAREWKKNVLFRAIAAVMNHFLRMVDFTASKNVDYFVANSEEVAGRIKKFYRRDATVIYPPVDTANRKSQTRLAAKRAANRKREYFLAGGRLARPKHIDLIVKACKELDVPLKVFGKGFAGYDSELRSLVSSHQSLVVGNTEKTSKGANDQRPKSNVQFVGEVTDEEKQELMQNAKAFLFASEDEDFGIVPVEAMAAGIPVIAYRSGGVKETVIDGKTGMFFDELTVESLIKTMKQFNNLPAGRQGVTFDPSACQKRSEKFSKERFVREIRAFIQRFEQK